MNVYVPTSVTPASSPRRIGARPRRLRQPLRWLSGVLAGATAIVAVVLIAAQLLSPDAQAPMLSPPEPDPFYQQKVDAGAGELPAQF